MFMVLQRDGGAETSTEAVTWGKKEGSGHCLCICE